MHADRGFAGRIATIDWDERRGTDDGRSAFGRTGGAVQAGLAALESLLVRKDFLAAGGEANALPDRPLEERGP